MNALAPRKGRGAVANVMPRYERWQRERGGMENDCAEDGCGEDTPDSLHTTVQIETARSIISRNQSPDIFFDQSINPYRGCEHGCIYCYARPNHAYVGLSPGLDFETRLFAKTNAPELLRRELSAPGYVPKVINLGSVTDAYQPIERTHRITRRLIEVLSECRHPFTLITKASLIERDLDVLAPLAVQGLVAASISLTSLDSALSRVLEPRCAAPARRLETIRRLTQAGVPVAVSVAPIIPFINEPEIEHLLAAAREAGASFAHYTVIRLPREVAPLFEAWLLAHFADRADRVLHRIADMRDFDASGRRNDPRFGTRMRGEGPWASLIRQRFLKTAARLGLRHERPALRCDLFVAPHRLANAQGSLF